MCLSVSRHRVHHRTSRPTQLLGPGVWHVRVPLLLPDPRGHHQRVLQPDGEASAQRAHPVRLQGEGPQPAAHHAHGSGGGGRVRGVLDAGADHGAGQDAGLQPAQPADGGAHALLHCAGLRQQQPQPGALRLPGRELQALLRRVLLPVAVPPGRPAVGPHAQHRPRGGLQLQDGGRPHEPRMTRRGTAPGGRRAHGQSGDRLLQQRADADHHPLATRQPLRCQGPGARSVPGMTYDSLGTKGLSSQCLTHVLILCPHPPLRLLSFSSSLGFSALYILLFLLSGLVCHFLLRITFQMISLVPERNKQTDLHSLKYCTMSV